MSNINKQALREAAKKATGAHDRLSAMPAEDIFDISQHEGTQLDADITALNSFNEAANPAAVLALLDELEAAQSYAKERDEENQDLMLTVGRLRVERETSKAEMGNALCQLLPGCHYMDPPDGGNVTPLEQVRRMVADYRERIAELEAREVKLPDVEKWRSPEAVRAQNAYRALVGQELSAAGIITKVGE